MLKDFYNRGLVAILRFYISFVFFGFVGIIFPFLLTQGKFSFILSIFYTIVIYSAFRLAKLMNKTTPKLLEISFFVFVYVFMGITPLAQVYYSNFPLLGEYSNSSILFCGFLIILGIIGYEIGLFLGNKRELNSEIIRNYTSGNLNLNLLIIIALIGFIVASQKFGGIQNLFLARNELNSMLNSTLSLVVYTAILRIPILIALLFALVKWMNRGNHYIIFKSDFKLISSVIILFIVNIIASNPFASARFWLGTVILSIVFIMLKWKKYTLQITIILFLMIMLIVFPYSDIFRNSTENISLNVNHISTTLTEDGDLDAFQMLLNAKKYTDTYGYSYGKQLLGTFLFWVPRSIWEGKPIGSGQLVAEAMGYKFTNLSQPLWGEFYINFGSFGVFLLFLLYGWMTSKLQQGFIFSQELGLVTFYRVFVPIYAAYQIFLVRGELLSTFANLAFSIVFIIVGLKLSTLKKDNRESNVKMIETTL